MLQYQQLKCGGQRNGCERCKSTFTRCVYSQSSNNRRRRRAHTSTSRDLDESAVQPSYHSSPPGRDRVARCTQPLDTPWSPITADGLAAPHTVYGLDRSSGRYTSPIQSLEDGSIISEDILQELMPAFGAQFMQECSGVQRQPSQMTINEHTYSSHGSSQTPGYGVLTPEGTQTFPS